MLHGSRLLHAWLLGAWAHKALRASLLWLAWQRLPAWTWADLLRRHLTLHWLTGLCSQRLSLDRTCCVIVCRNLDHTQQNLCLEQGLCELGVLDKYLTSLHGKGESTR